MGSSFWVTGIPAPQGSKIRTPYGMRESSQRVMPWREAVKAAAMVAGVAGIHSPVHVDIVFWFERPKSHYGTGRNAGTVKAAAPAFPTTRNIGDVDKLQRSTFDALTDVGVIDDDSMIASVSARKRWCDAGKPLAGAYITIVPLEQVLS